MSPFGVTEADWGGLLHQNESPNDGNHEQFAENYTKEIPPVLPLRYPRKQISDDLNAQVIAKLLIDKDK